MQKLIEDEVIYHVFQRSFYDSNGDKHGDLLGLKSKLDYLQDLGITSILMLPIYESAFYHNYFATDFRAIDRLYGSEEDYFSLLRAVHERGMKLYLDMEVQYVTEDHLWYSDSYGNPASIYSEHILYNGPNNTEPESIIFDLTEIKSYDGKTKKVACLDLMNSLTQQRIFEEFAYWTDPHGDASLSDGIDGFRLDHMMDNLDDKDKLVGVYKNFWRPLIGKVRSINPRIKFLGEQADWESHGGKAFVEADVDYMFAFPLKFAISNLNRDAIRDFQLEGLNQTPESKKQIVLLENHDTHRFASTIGANPSLLRIGAALNLLLKGIPSIYYGQELGMKGRGGFGVYGISDGNDIPRREAFPWMAKVHSEGVCLWYEDSGPWWDDTELQDDDGISVQEQINDPQSLLNFYKSLIQFRKSSIAIQEGEIHFCDLHNDYVLGFIRSVDTERVLVIVSLSSDKQQIRLEGLELGKVILSYPRLNYDVNVLLPYAIMIFHLEK